MKQNRSRDPTRPKTSKIPPPFLNFMNPNKPITSLSLEPHEFSSHPHTLCFFYLLLLSLQRPSESSKYFVQLFQTNS